MKFALKQLMWAIIACLALMAGLALASHQTHPHGVLPCVEEGK